MFEYDQEILRTSDVKKEHNLSSILTKSINKIIQNEGYVTYSMFVRDISTEGGNYLSLLKEVDIKGATVDHNKKTHLFIKQSLPESENQLVHTKEIFLKEIFIYTELAELFNKLQNEFNVPEEDKYNFVKYYNGDEYSLIFDNMTRKGFKICNRFETIPLKVLEESIKNLAKFHGFSIVLKKYRPDFYNNKIQTLKHPYVFDDAGQKFLVTLCNVSLDYLEDDIKGKIEMRLPGFVDKYVSYITKNDCKFKCLCHGDYRMNNILVKGMNSEIPTVIPIDYQVAFYGSPVIDFLYVIFTSTNQQFRRRHMENLKEIYFETFTKYLRYFNIDVESVYSREDFENDFQIQLDYGLIVSLMVLPFILASEDDVPELSKELKTMKLHDCFKTRIEGIVDDYVEWGYL